MTSNQIISLDEHYSDDPHSNVVNTRKTVEDEDDVLDRVSNSTDSQTNPHHIRKALKFCLKSSATAYFGTVLFIIISMLIGILTICFTSPTSNNACKRTYGRTVTDLKNYNSLPQSVAIGYFNNDTQLDFVVANTGTDTINIYLGYDNETFRNEITYSTGLNSHPYSVATGNFDNKNGIDIAVANFGVNSIGIFLGFNNGSFILERSFSTNSSHPLFLTVADLNTDDRLDIAVVNYGTNSISVFFGFGDGSFTLSMTYSTGYDSFPNSLTIADLNNDKYLDIIVANYGTDSIGIFFGYENGTFENQKIYYADFGSNPSSVVTSDINNDNYLDIIVANYGKNNIGIFFGYGNRSFSRQIKYSTGYNSHSQFVSIGDFNKDQQLDIIAIDSVNGKVYILPGNENGTFPLLTMYSTDFESSPFLVAVDDFDNDNKSDAIVVNRKANNVLTLMGYDITTFASYNTFTIDSLRYPFAIATGDLNGDNVLDIVVGSYVNDLLNIFLGYGNGSFSFLKAFSTGGNSYVTSVVLEDFNNDHQLDIVAFNPGSYKLGVLLGYGNGMFSVATTYSISNGSYPRALAVDNINNDNCLDIVVLNNGTDIIKVLLGFCNGSFAIVSTDSIELGPSPVSIVIDDFNNDSRQDAAIVTLFGNIGIFLGDGYGTFAIVTTYTVSSLSRTSYITSGDFNNDNRSDIAVALLTNNQIDIFLGHGNGTFVYYSINPIESCVRPYSLVVSDFNNDNKVDIAANCIQSYTVVVLFGNNNGDFLTQMTYSTGAGSYPYSFAIGDFNNDNLLDIATANYDRHSVGIFMSYYYANFAIQTKYMTGSGPHPYSLAIADFNHDNISDIVVANSGNDNIGIRLGIGNGSFEIETTYSTGRNSLPQYVTVGDFNLDKHLDIVTANYKSDSISIFFGYGNGSFTESLTYPINIQSNPTSIAVADLNNDKWLDLVVANEGKNNVGILYGYNYATFDLQYTYSSSYGSYPRAVSVGDFNNDNHLDIAVANYYESTVSIFFGYGNGSFTTQIYFSTGFQSNPAALAVADLNNDGYLDIVVANARALCIGILFGYGNGTFTAIKTYPIVGTNPSALAIGDVNNDGRLDIIVAIKNNDIVGVFLGLDNGSVSLIKTYSTGLSSRPNSIVLGDLNNDSYLDIAVANVGSRTVVILQGYGNGSFALSKTYSFLINSNPSSITLGDFNHDHHPDIAVADTVPSNIAIFLGLGNGSFSTQKTYYTGVSSLPSYIIVDFFNDDDHADIVVICSGSSTVTIFFGTSDGEFLQGRSYVTSGNSLIKLMAYGDFNNDSRLDLVITNALNDNMDIFIGNGSEPFSKLLNGLTYLNSKPHSLAIGDFNNDNRSDIVIANYGTDNIGILLADEIEIFLNMTMYSSGIGSRPYAVVVDDFNNDHQLDIAVVNSGTDVVTIFQGYGNGSFAAIESYSTGTGSTPYAIALGDFDNDKQMDLAIVNAGTNNLLLLFGFGNGSFGNEISYPMDYNSNPYSIAVGNFNNDTWIDIAIANNGADYIEILLNKC